MESKSLQAGAGFSAAQQNVVHLFSSKLSANADVWRKQNYNNNKPLQGAEESTKPKPKKSSQKSRWQKLAKLSKTVGAVAFDVCPPVHYNLHPWTESEKGALRKYQPLMLDLILEDGNEEQLYTLLKDTVTSVDRREVDAIQAKIDVMDFEMRTSMLTSLEKATKTLPLRRAKLGCLLKCLRGRAFGLQSLLDALRHRSLMGNHDDIALAVQTEHQQREALAELHDRTNQVVRQVQKLAQHSKNPAGKSMEEEDPMIPTVVPKPDKVGSC